MRNKKKMSESRSSPVLYSGGQESILPPPPPPPPLQLQQQPQPPPPQPPPPPQTQQRVHVIKKNIYLMTSSPGNNGCTGTINGGCGNTTQMVSIYDYHSNRCLCRFSFKE